MKTEARLLLTDHTRSTKGRGNGLFALSPFHHPAPSILRLGKRGSFRLKAPEFRKMSSKDVTSKCYLFSVTLSSTPLATPPHLSHQCVFSLFCFVRGTSTKVSYHIPRLFHLSNRARQPQACTLLCDPHTEAK